VQLLERAQADGLEHRLTGDGREDVRSSGPLEPGQGATANRLPKRRLRDLRQNPRIVERVDGRQARGLADAFERVRRDVAQHRARVVAHGRIGVFTRDRRQHFRIHQLSDRGAPHAGVFVFAGRGDDLLMFRERQLFDVCESDRRIRVFLRLRAKSIEKSHEIPSAVSRSATSWPCDAVRTCLSMSRMRPSRPM
jgi:hypothetical protein